MKIALTSTQRHVLAVIMPGMAPLKDMNEVRRWNKAFAALNLAEFDNVKLAPDLTSNGIEATEYDIESVDAKFLVEKVPPLLTGQGARVLGAILGIMEEGAR